MCFAKRRRGQRNSTSADVIAVRQLVFIANDDLIAGILNRDGLRAAMATDGPAACATRCGRSYRVPVFKPRPRTG